MGLGMEGPSQVPEPQALAPGFNLEIQENVQTPLLGTFHLNDTYTPKCTHTYS